MKITSLETIRLPDYPSILFVTVHTDLRVNYPELVTDLPAIENGHILAPTRPGLGTALLPDVRTRPGAVVRQTR